MMAPSQNAPSTIKVAVLEFQRPRLLVLNRLPKRMAGSHLQRRRGIQERRKGSAAGTGRRAAGPGSGAFRREGRGSRKANHRSRVIIRHTALRQGRVLGKEGGAFSFHFSIVTRNSGT